MKEKKSTTFEGNVLRLISGTGIGQVVSLAVSPVLTRLFAPEAFGMAAIFTAITGIIGSLVCLRYEQAIVLPKDDDEAANILYLCLLVAMVVSGSTFLLITYFDSGFYDIEHLIQVGGYLWLVPLSVLISGIYFIFQFWNTRTKNYTRISISTVSGSIANTGTSLSLGSLGHVTGGSLILASIGGQIVSSVMLAFQIIRADGKFLLKSFSLRKILLCIKRYRKFPLYGSWSILLGNGAWLLPTILMGAYFSPVFVGYYALGFRILQVPTSLIGSSIGQVFLQESAEAQINGTLPELLERLFEKLVALSLLPFLMLMVIGQDMYAFVFGSEWREAGLYTQILAPWALLWFLSSPLTCLFTVMERQKLQLRWNVANFLTRVLAIFVGVYFNSSILTVILLGFFGVIVYGYKIVLSFRIAKTQLANSMKYFTKQLFISAVPTGFVFILTEFEVSTFLSVSAASMIVFINIAFFSSKALKAIRK
ncbi:MAG: oligosaccharide flippase family protein [Sedimenticola sp.]|nr:oligosaccharide flippase family protein [Sedimenticola sp.]